MNPPYHLCRKKTFFIVIIFLRTFCFSQPLGYNFVKTITINPAQVSGAANFSDFPVLIKTTDPNLANTSNGGNVSHASGYDIMFTTQDCSVKLDHEIEQYNPTNGELVVWVKVPTLFTNANTVIHMYYGNPTLTVNSSTTSTWSGKYETVLHLHENPANSVPQMIDATVNTNNGICGGSMTATNSVAGIASNGVVFDEINDRIVIADFDYANTKSFAISFWFNVNDNTGSSFQYLFSHGNLGAFNATNIYLAEATNTFVPDQNMLKTVFQDANDATNYDALDAGNTYIDGNWHYYVFSVADLGPPRVFIDGTEIANVPFNGGQTYNPTTHIYLGARNNLDATRFYGGKLDEFRIMNDSLTADWIQTEYNNQSSPGTFYSVSTQSAALELCSILPIQLLDFEATMKEDNTVLLNWSTAIETNNDYFLVERSLDAISWETIKKVKGAKNSHSTQYYSSTDTQPFNGTSYYRLKQVDTDGNYMYSKIRLINLDKKGNLLVYPNPVNDVLHISTPSGTQGNFTITLYDNTGRTVYNKSIELQKEQNNVDIDVNDFPKGIYLLKAINNEQTEPFYKKIQIK